MKAGFGQLAIVLLLCAGVACASTGKKHVPARRGASPSGHHAPTSRGTTTHASAGHAGTGRHAAASRRGTRSGTPSAFRTVRIHGKLRRVPVRYVEHFTASSFASDIGTGDISAGEDPVVRAAAIQALGNMNGTALAIDPSSGRILAMVNQHLALSSGAEPCSTIKVAVALAALKEGLITAETPVNLGGHYSLDLTHAMAKSVNLYFEVLGRAMGFERVKHYANEFGLGELAGYNIAGEQLGAAIRTTELPAVRWAAWARMCSFGESVSA